MTEDDERKRAECEAKEVAGWTQDKRNWFYTLVSARRGQDAADRLRAAVLKHINGEE